MKININRICELAGINKKPGMLNEAGNRSMHEDPGLSGEGDYRYGSNQLNEYEEFEPEAVHGELEDPDLEDDEWGDEIIEVDEATLVQELRRAKRVMKESYNVRRRKAIQESEIKAIIDDEVKSVMRELRLSSGWVYGNKKPKRSKKGYVHQGSFLKGIGFK